MKDAMFIILLALMWPIMTVAFIVAVFGLSLCMPFRIMAAAIKRLEYRLEHLVATESTKETM